MNRKKGFAALDDFRMLAALLVITIHTSPLASLNDTADFVLTRVLARVAVPFFLMVTGYFLERGPAGSTRRTCKKLALLYGASILLYLPLNLYAGGIRFPEAIKMLLVDGTFYHLWYLPAALLGIGAVLLLRKLRMRYALLIAGLLYLIGLFGDSYYGLVEGIPFLRAAYGGIFNLSSYTRNGLFYAPLFLLLGMAGRKWSRKVSAVGFACSLAAMCGEALLLRQFHVQRHDSMYLLLPVCMLFLFSLLLNVNRGQRPAARSVSMLVYLLHPWCIVLVRGGAKLLHLESLFIENSLLHFLAVCLLSLALSWLLYALRPIRVPARARAWREIDGAALRHNAAVLQAALGDGCKLMAVVKANAYGHGAVKTARILNSCGVKAFGVATLPEGIALRKAGIRGTILILGWTDPRQAALLSRWRLTQAVVDEAYGAALAAQGKRISVHIALDTGMHRLGIPAENLEAIQRTFRRKALRVDGMFTHLCTSGSLTAEDREFALRQTGRFYRAADALAREGYNPGVLHIQASYGVWNLEPQPCGYARIGIALYGVQSDASPVRNQLDLWPVLSLRARVASVRMLPAGEGAGYGQVFHAGHASKLAAVSIGYADGIPRALAGKGEALVHGQRVPIVDVNMDQLLIDVTGIPDMTCPGDIVTFIGRDGGACIRAEEVAERCNTITNELLSRLGDRLAVR